MVEWVDCSMSTPARFNGSKAWRSLVFELWELGDKYCTARGEHIASIGPRQSHGSGLLLHALVAAMRPYGAIRRSVLLLHQLLLHRLAVGGFKLQPVNPAGPAGGRKLTIGVGCWL